LIPIRALDRFKPEFDPFTLLRYFVIRDPQSHATDEFLHSLIDKLLVDSGLPIVPNLTIGVGFSFDNLFDGLLRGLIPHKSPMDSFETRDLRSFTGPDFINPILSNIVSCARLPLVPNILITDDSIRDLMSSAFLDDVARFLQNDAPSRPIEHFSICDARTVVTDVAPVLDRFLNVETLPLLPNHADDDVLTALTQTDFIDKVQEAIAPSFFSFPSLELRDPRSFVTDDVVIQALDRVFSRSDFPLRSNEIGPNVVPTILDPAIISHSLGSIVQPSLPRFTTGEPHVVVPEDFCALFVTNYLREIHLPLSRNVVEPIFLADIIDTSVDAIVDPVDLTCLTNLKRVEPLPVIGQLADESPLMTSEVISEIASPDTSFCQIPRTDFKGLRQLQFSKTRKPVDLPAREIIGTAPTKGVSPVLHKDQTRSLASHPIKRRHDPVPIIITTEYLNDLLLPSYDQDLTIGIGFFNALRSLEALAATAKDSRATQPARPVANELQILAQLGLKSTFDPLLEAFVDDLFEHELFLHVLSEMPVRPFVQPPDPQVAADGAAGDLLEFDPKLDAVVATPVEPLSEFQLRPDVAAARNAPTSPFRDVIVDILLRCYERDDDSDDMSDAEYRTTWLNGEHRKPVPLPVEGAEEEEEEEEAIDHRENESEAEDIKDKEDGGNNEIVAKIEADEDVKENDEDDIDEEEEEEEEED
jgi:hypothetical protein